MQGARAAVIFLTRLPAGRAEAGDFARAPGWFAAVGLLIGAVQAGAFVLGAALWGGALGALAALAAGILLTGALHEDGLADTFDGLGGGASAERALEIMRDSRIGSFGALALGLVLGATVMALARLGPGGAPAALLAAAALSRAVMALMLRHGPYLRAQGAGAGLTGAQGLTGNLVTLLAVAAALALGWAGLGIAVLGGLAGLGAGAGLVWLWARRRLGGVTGDILGAGQQMGVLGFLLGALAWL
ncbi:MAG: adenosylcobinamide-GDP ribazoletransferase [Pararhodobacter sp.]|nr:adenosylcobinamide-GDP ribazoletransferase [Pararhodobacter sp.]